MHYNSAFDFTFLNSYNVQVNNASTFASCICEYVYQF